MTNFPAPGGFETTDALKAAVSSVFGRSGAVVAAPGDYTAAQVTNAADKSSASQQTFTGNVSAPAYVAAGLTGATAASRYVGATASGAPGSGTFAVGDFVIDQTGKTWVCTAAGSPGTWVQPRPSYVFRTVHTFAVGGAIAVPTGAGADLTNYIPPMFVSVGANEVVQLVKARYVIGTGTSATVDLQRNGVGATGFTALSVTTTAAQVTPTGITLAENDTLAPVVTAVSASPGNLSFSVVLEHTVS